MIDSKQRLIVGALLVAFLFVGILIGRYTTPTTTEKDIEYRVQHDEVVHYQAVEKVAINWTVIKDTKTDRTKVTVTQPDGTKVETEHEATQTHEENTGTKTEIKTVEVIKEVHVVDWGKVHELVKAGRPDWKLGAQVGLSFPDLGSPNTPLVFGATVDRRVLGPFFLQVWGNNKLQGGTGLSFEF
jgi:hypothetical protein